jgi:hypothetical protein
MNLSLPRIADFTIAVGDCDPRARAGYSIDSRSGTKRRTVFCSEGQRLDGHDFQQVEQRRIGAIVRKDQLTRDPRLACWPLTTHSPPSKPSPQPYESAGQTAIGITG